MLEDEEKTSKSGSALSRLLIGKLIEDDDYWAAHNANSMFEQQGSLIDACYGKIYQFLCKYMLFKN